MHTLTLEPKHPVPDANYLHREGNKFVCIKCVQPTMSSNLNEI